jgi:putative membrane protein
VLNHYQRRAHLLAHEQLLDLGLSSTRRQTGVMLFVSVAERYVEIIADAGVQADVDDRLWQGIIDRFVDKVRTGSFAEGFADAIDACTAEIAKHHPRTADDVNELPNRLVEI